MVLGYLTAFARLAEVSEGKLVVFGVARLGRQHCVVLHIKGGNKVS